MTTEEIAKVWLLTIKGGWIFSPKAFSREEHLSIVSAPFFLGNRASRHDWGVSIAQIRIPCFEWGC